ncbi:hypothetical protein ACWDLG_40785 [Nonomuraea sp. NPDC003727]
MTWSRAPRTPARRASIVLGLLAVTVVLHLLMCAFGPHGHHAAADVHAAGATTSHSHHHAPGSHEHTESCDMPATQPSPGSGLAVPAGARVAAEELTERPLSRPDRPADAAKPSGVAILTMVCVTRV